MTVPDPDGPRPSVAGERTDLAWNRSGLSLLACGAAVLRGLGRSPLHAGSVAVGASILLLGSLTWGLGGWWAARRARRSGTGAATSADLLPVALGAAAVGVAVFVLAAFFPS